MLSCEQTLRLFEKWCMEEQGIAIVDKVNENVICRYMFDLQERDKEEGAKLLPLLLFIFLNGW